MRYLRFLTVKGATRPVRDSRYVGMYRQRIYTMVRAKDVQVGDCIADGPTEYLPITSIEEVDEQRVSQELRWTELYL